VSIRWWSAAAVALVLLALGPPTRAADEKASDAKSAADKQDAEKPFVLSEPIVVSMEEVPNVREEVRNVSVHFPRGPYVMCGTTPNKEVKTYPKFKSSKPLYGFIRTGGDLNDPAGGTKLFFALDESGEKAAEPEKKAEAEKAEPKKITVTVNGEQRTLIAAARPALVRGKPGYDRLILDVNGDLDLTNDPVVKAAEKPSIDGISDLNSVAFEDVTLTIDCGPAGKRPFAVMPRVRSYGVNQAMLDLIPKTVRRGTVRLGDREYVAFLNQYSILTGRYDSPSIYLELLPTKSGRQAAPIQAGYLGATRLVGETYASLSATPLGDKLTIEPYKGDMGVLEIGPGGRAITEMGAAGSLASKNGTLPFGDTRPIPGEKLPRRVSLPVGDYSPMNLTIQYGRLRLGARQYQGTTPEGAKAPKFGIEIRKDKPFVLDFAGRPQVIFQAPAEGAKFQPGAQVRLACMLTEPDRGVMITNLEDSTKKKGDLTYSIGGEPIKVPQYERLDPTITIRNSRGEEVATGKMPFG
jgi:hypothetical protein